MIEDVPCKGCNERVLYCHSNCEKYKLFKERKQCARDRERSESAVNKYFYSAQQRSKNHNKYKK